MRKYLNFLIATTCLIFIFLLSSCGEIETDTSSESVCTHQNEVLLEGREPSCIRQGLTNGTKCADCGDIIIAQKIIATTAHQASKEEIENRTEPTCLKSGYYDEVTRCSLCDTLLIISPITIPATGHTESKLATVLPTCEKTGLTEGTECTVCGEAIIIQEEIPPNGHAPLPAVIENKLEPTCKSGSYDEVAYCEICNAEVSRVSNVIPPLYPHSPLPSVRENYIEPICKMGGYDEVIYCSECDSILEKASFTLEPQHTPITLDAVLPTCTENGFTEGEKCSLCEAILVEQTIILASGHVKGEAKIEDKVEATCKDGSYNSVVYCLTCGEPLSKEIIILPAKDKCKPSEALKENYVEPKCKTGGYDSITYCSVCEKMLSKTHITLEAVHKKEATKGYPPTCTSDGLSDGEICTDCKKVLVKQNVIPKGHTEITINGEAPTCISNGYTDGKECSVCHTVLLEKTVIPPNPSAHQTEILPATQATCKETGLTKGERCILCKETVVPQEITPLLPHSEVKIEAVSPTCTKDGSTEGKKCSVCGTVTVKPIPIPKSEHQFSEPTYQRPATCISCGITTGDKLQQQPINIRKPSLPQTQYDTLLVTSCSYSTVWNGDGTYDVTVQISFKNISPVSMNAGVYITLSGIEPSDGTAPHVNAGATSSCTVKFFDVPFGNYEIIIEN